MISVTVTYKTAPGIVNPDFNMARASNEENSSNESISPIVLYAVFGIGAGIILVLVIGSFVLIRMKCQAAQPNDPRTNKNYHNAEAISAATRDKLNPPPDLWIGHDQLELKDISDENGSAICDETGETTLTRSTPDYRATMERTRNYIQNGQFSGLCMLTFSKNTCLNFIYTFLQFFGLKTFFALFILVLGVDLDLQGMRPESLC